MAARARIVRAFGLLAGGLLAALVSASVSAMVGGAPSAADGAGRAVGMVRGSYGTARTATATARDLLLTAAHGVQRGADYKLVAREVGQDRVLKDILRIEREPQFD